MDTVIRIEGKVQWQCLRGAGGNWIGVCEPLKLTLQSATWGDLMEDIALSLDAFLKELTKSQELEKFLREHGWALMGHIPKQLERVRFDLPFFPAMMGTHGSQNNLHQ